MLQLAQMMIWLKEIYILYWTKPICVAMIMSQLHSYTLETNASQSALQVNFYLHKIGT